MNRPDGSLGSEDTWAGHGQLRFVFRSRHELLVSGDYSRARGVPLILARPLAPNSKAPVPVHFDIPDDFWSVRPNDLAERQNGPGGASARLTVRLGDTATLTSLTAYRDGDVRLFVDSDTTELRLATARLSEHQRQVSQEVTLARRTARLNWIGGISWYDERNRGPFELSLFRLGNQYRLRPAIDAEAWALFGQARYSLSKGLAVTGGLRYSREREEAHAIAGGLREYDVATTVADRAWTPKGSIELEASRNTFLFLSATRGFKGGGVNLSAPSLAASFAPSSRGATKQE